MQEFMNLEMLSWILLLSICALIGGTILGKIKKEKLGILLGLMLGPLGLIVVVLICQWEEGKQI